MSTIYDVAKLAGVSYATVSSVLSNGSMRVADTTRQRIIEAAKSLNYQANRAARQLVTGKYDTVGLCFEKESKHVFLDPVANQLIAGIGCSASQNGHFLLLAPTAPGYRFEETISSLPSHGVDGGIVIGPMPLSKASISAIDGCGVPLVCIDSYAGFASASTVDTDNAASMKMGVEHLISMGHTKLAYISSPPLYQCVLDRTRGFNEALTEAGLLVGDQITHTGPLEEVPALIGRIAETVDGPTALVCADVTIGGIVLDEVMRLGMRVPDDLSILVYDEVPTRHQLLESVDTIRSNFYAMGEAAGDLLKRVIDGKSPERVSIRLRAELVVRSNR